MMSRGTFRKETLRAGGLLVLLAAVALPGALPALAGPAKETRCTGKLEDCVKTLAEKMKSSGWVGIELDIDQDKGTCTIQKVIKGSPAAAAGLRPGDLIVAVNGEPFEAFSKQMLKGKSDCSKPGQAVTYVIKRGGVDQTIHLKLVPMPAEVLARYIGEHVLLHIAEPDRDAKDKK